MAETTKVENKHQALKRFLKRKSACVCMVILIIMIIVCFIIPLLADKGIINMDAYSYDTVKSAPSAKHILGTDDVGRDCFARLLYGGRVSLTVAFFSTVIAAVIGILFGLLAGYFRGFWEVIVMRLTDIFMSFPSNVFALVLVAVFKPSVLLLTIVIGILSWVSFAKLIYSQTISVKEKDYIEAARAMGNSSFRILFKYILPNVMAPIWITFTLHLGMGIMIESGLSFLGVGVQPPTASWGNIINSAQKLMILKNCPWMWLPAGLCLVVFVICINVVGEGLRAALDPKTRI